VKSACIALYLVILGVLGVFSYGFIDPGLTLTQNPLFIKLQVPLFNLVYHNRPVASLLFFSILIILFVCYCIFLLKQSNIFPSLKKIILIAGISSVILVFSYPALSYDLFNYMTTAKVTYGYGENPYVVMPIEIPNEPYLAFTRAANKYALYGPVWLAITAVPHYLGGGSIWGTIIAFKALNALIYIGFVYFIYKVTKSLKNTVFFAFNPLVLIEVLVSGHNDIYMMFFALTGLIFWYQKGIRQKIYGFILFVCSWFIKGATIVLLPLIFFKRLSLDKALLTTYYLLLATFIIIAPLREELYPWYAVWLVMVVSLMSFIKNRFIAGLTLVLSFALELRHLPYMWMGYYEGPGPMLRLLVTVLPVAIYLLYYSIRIVKRKSS
jgi:hypothetical protein